MIWYPKTPVEFLLAYAGVMFLAIIIVFWRKPKRGMILRLRRSSQERVEEQKPPALTGAQPLGEARLSHIQPRGERPLNVMFNYNGHSWDAYEVLGLPAGASPERVEGAFKIAMKTVEVGSRPFMVAAYRAIQAEWDSYRKASEG